MTEFVDSVNGVAAFRIGRSLCIRLHGQLDEDTARTVASRLRDDHRALRLRLECSSLDGLEPGAARLLAGALLAWSQRADGRSVDILNLGLSLQQRLAWHPLRIFLEPDEILFVDPDREAAGDLAPSRH